MLRKNWVHVLKTFVIIIFGCCKRSNSKISEKTEQKKPSDQKLQNTEYRNTCEAKVSTFKEEDFEIV